MKSTHKVQTPAFVSQATTKSMESANNVPQDHTSILHISSVLLYANLDKTMTQI